MITLSIDQFKASFLNKSVHFCKKTNKKILPHYAKENINIFMNGHDHYITSRWAEWMLWLQGVSCQGREGCSKGPGRRFSAPEPRPCGAELRSLEEGVTGGRCSDSWNWQHLPISVLETTLPDRAHCSVNSDLLRATHGQVKHLMEMFHGILAPCTLSD